MNRIDFMRDLEARLGALSEEDRADALRYYDELFDEAGPIEEQKILDDLGSPADIARQILVDNGVSPDGDPEFMIDDVIRKDGTTPPPPVNAGPIENKNTKILLIVIIAIVTSPVWGGLLGGALGLLGGFIGVIATLFAVLGCGGMALLVVGIVRLFSVPPLGLCEMGAGLVLCGIAVLTIVPLCKWIFGLLKRFINWIVYTVKKFLNKENA